MSVYLFMNECIHTEQTIRQVPPPLAVATPLRLSILTRLAVYIIVVEYLHLTFLKQWVLDFRQLKTKATSHLSLATVNFVC